MEQKKQIRLIVWCLFLSCTTFAQIISGNLSLLSNQEIKLEGFDGLNTYLIATTKIDPNGNFKLSYGKTAIGVGYLKSVDEKPRIVILSGEDIEIKGENLINSESIKILKDQENQWFEHYIQEHGRREQALSAWYYLDKMYTLDSLFSVQATPSNIIQKEKQRIKSEDVAFLESLPKRSYVKWFLTTRKLLSSTAIIAQFRTEEIPMTIQAFRELAYTDPRMYKSGLLREAIDNHFWLIENSGKPMDEMFEEMKVSIDTIFLQLVDNEKRLNEITYHLFTLLEKRSLFTASEYLALKILNNASCKVDNDLALQLETYRAMKKGTVTADIDFDKSSFADATKTVNKLSEIKSNYTVLVFGASWCPKCQEDLPEIAKLYRKWQAKNIEVVFVAVENDKKEFVDFSKSLPFPAYSDLKKWDSKIVRDYYIFSTPTLLLLNNKREIILKPYSVEHLNVWMDAFLFDENK